MLISIYLKGNQIHKKLYLFTESTATKYATMCRVPLCEIKLEETKGKMTAPCPHRAYSGRDIEIKVFTDTTTVKEENKQDDVIWEVLSIRLL